MFLVDNEAGWYSERGKAAGPADNRADRQMADRPHGHETPPRNLLRDTSDPGHENPIWSENHIWGHGRELDTLKSTHHWPPGN